MRNMSSRVLSSCMVKPKEDTPNHNIWLCNLDVCTGPVRYTPVIYVYKSNRDANFFDFKAHKDGLARTLVPFYPYAGRLCYDHDQRIHIECTGEGVLLVEASCDSTVDEMGDFSPSPELRKLFLPPSSSPNPPCLLVMIQPSVRFRLRSGAHEWRCGCLARELPLNRPTVLKFPASVRKCFNPPILPEAMFINAPVHLKSEAPVNDIVSGNFQDVARRIEDTVASLSGEYLRSFVDFLEKENNFMKKAWMGFKESEVRVVSWLGFPLYEADFGWGKPVFVGRASQTLPGRFYLNLTHSGDRGVLVTVTLEEAALHNFAELFYTELKPEDEVEI